MRRAQTGTMLLVERGRHVVMTAGWCRLTAAGTAGEALAGAGQVGHGTPIA